MNGYRREIEAARRRSAARERRSVEDPRLGAIEYTEWGDGPALILSHPLFGGFDLGSELAPRTRRPDQLGARRLRPLCAMGSDNNKTRIYKPDAMDADHVTAWSKGGNSDLKNCQMLCVTHNRAKGNR